MKEQEVAAGRRVHIDDTVEGSGQDGEAGGYSNGRTRSAGSEWAGLRSLFLVVVLIWLAVYLRPRLQEPLDDPAVANWATIFVAVTVQALPFLVLGVAISGAVAAFVPTHWFTRALPRRPVLAVPVAAMSGMALPGCECGSVPIARRLIDRGVTPAAALTFLLSAPAVNPVVLVATAVAFPDQPAIVVARLLASMLAATAVGLIWTALRRDALLRRSRRAAPQGGSRLQTFTATAHHDFLDAGGFLVLGAAAAATLQTVVPRSVLDAFAGSGWWSVLALAVLAVMLALCSEADAFIAASLKQFSPTAQLALMVVGPMVDIKLIALQIGTFGRRFTMLFAPLTFACALAATTLVGWWLL